MVKKALCVGCNYPSKAFGLAGAVNDAFLIADCLQKNCGFEPENVCVLHDLHPGQKKSMKVEPSKKPTRVNILQRLQWLVRNARGGDVLFFSFSGYGLQVDDMDGYQDEGFDEAILPTDFVDGRDGDYTVIVTDDIHDILMGIPPNCACTVLMDCDHATSVIDVSGTLDGGLVQGLKYQHYCGLKVHTTKVQLAQHNREVWQEERARNVKARPRFQPMMEIDNPRKGRLPTRPAMSRSSPVAFCYSAAAHGQTAMEMQMSRMVDGKDTPKQHGVLTWCFVQALEELRYECTHTELLWAVRKQMAAVKEKDLPRLDQEVLLTFSTPLSNPQTMKVLQPLPLMAGRGQSIQLGGTTLGGEGTVAAAPPPGAAPNVSIVPPPPPGVIPQGAGAGTGGTGAGGGAGGPPPSGYSGPPPAGPGGPPPNGVGAPVAQVQESLGQTVQAVPQMSDRPPSPPRPPQQQLQQQRDSRPPSPPPPPPPRRQPSIERLPPGNVSPREMTPTAVTGTFSNMPDLALPSAPQVSALKPSGVYQAASPEPAVAGSTGGPALIPNFFNMGTPNSLLGQGNRGMQAPQPMPGLQPGAPGVRGLTPPNLLGGNSFPTRAASQGHSMSFTVPSGVGVPTPSPAIPAATVPSFQVGPAQAVPGRGYSFQAAPRR